MSGRKRQRNARWGRELGLSLSLSAGGRPSPSPGGAGLSRAARAGWGDLSTRAAFEVERPSPHPVSHFAALNVRRPSPSRGG
ncbi:hypothetical protein CWO91_04040 [Bradyrhizobium genosp. SA-3]|nr:hypothetical protein CWO91_04040 [Bradyrhizobium genosp. SA-3]